MTTRLSGRTDPKEGVDIGRPCPFSQALDRNLEPWTPHFWQALQENELFPPEDTINLRILSPIRAANVRRVALLCATERWRNSVSYARRRMSGIAIRQRGNVIMKVSVVADSQITPMTHRPAPDIKEA